MQTKTVTIVGLGYVGLPLAVLAREKGWDVTGLDNDPEKIQQINDGNVPAHGEELNKALQKYPISATSDPASIANAQVIVVAVPTPVNEKNLPDLTPLTSAVESLVPHLKPGQLLVIESTINPGVMDTVVVPILRKRTDLILEQDSPKTEEPLYLAHCPERINPGDPKWTVRNIARVLGGYSPEGTHKAQEFYESIIEAPIKVMASVTEAEAVKILENTFRDINIAFINEMAKSFDKLGIDIVNVIQGAATKPFAFLPHYPGNGVGGHCISVDPYYMIERAKEVGFDHQFLKLARRINDSMPEYTVERLKEELNRKEKKIQKSTIAMLGVAYKKNVADTRESPALVILQALKDQGATVRVYDPYVPEHSTVQSLDDALANADALMLACDHDIFVTELTSEKLTDVGITIVVDGKNALNHTALAAAGIAYSGVGRSRLPH